MTPNQRPTDGVALLASIDPASQGAGTVNSAWFSVTNFNSFLAAIKVGVMTATGTVDAKLQQAQDGAGTGAKDITGKAITQLLAAGGNNRQAYINARESDLDTNNAFSFIRLSITVATAASLINGDLFGFYPDFEPPIDSTANPAINLGAASVVQIVP